MNKNIAGMMLALLLAGCGGGESTQATAPAGTTPVTTPAATVPEEPIRTVSDNDSPVAVFVGDSITERWYPQLPDRYPYMVDVGITGQTSVQMLARFDRDVLSYHPANVVITAGTNDLLLLRDPNIDSIAQMADIAAAHNITVIIGLPPPNEYWAGSPFPDIATGRAAFASFRAQLRMLAAAHGYHVADFYTTMLLPDGTQDASLFQADRVHPNAAGYVVMWHEVSRFFSVAPGLPVCSVDPQICDQPSH